jgi:hypothetical protein
MCRGCHDAGVAYQNIDRFADGHVDNIGGLAATRMSRHGVTVKDISSFSRAIHRPLFDRI